MQVEEFNTYGLAIENGAFQASFVLKIQNADSSREWHYYGVAVPGDFINGIPTVQHDSVQVQLADLASSAYDVARQSAVDALTPVE